MGNPALRLPAHPGGLRIDPVIPPARIKDLRHVRGREIGILSFDEVPSTNLLAREMAATGSMAGPTLLRADRQSGGYGRFGRRWHSPAGGLWATLAWPVQGDSSRLIEGLGLRVGAACLDLVMSLVAGSPDSVVRLKWPNDVLISGRKVCGCLCEWVGGTQGRTWLLLGVGINANNNPADLPEDLRRPATSLRQALGEPVDLDTIAHDLTARLAGVIDPGAPGSPEFEEVSRLLTQAAANLRGVGEQVSAGLPDRSRFEGVLRGLSKDGRLVVEAGGASRVLPHGAELA